MKFKGKVAPWYWAILFLVNGMAPYFSALGESRTTEFAIYALIADFVLLPPIFRNYVRLEQGELTIAFGFGKDTVRVREIMEIYPTRSSLFASAASLDRIVLKTKENEFVCSVKQKDELIAELKKQNRRMTVREDAKKAKQKENKKSKK